MKYMGRPREFDEVDILRKATGLFGGKGFDVLSVDALLNALGMNRASFYKLYGSKHGLARAALAHVCERARSGDVDEQSKDFIVVALVELAGTDPDMRSLISTAVHLCFGGDMTMLGQHVVARAHIDIDEGVQHD